MTGPVRRDPVTRPPAQEVTPQPLGPQIPHSFMGSVIDFFSGRLQALPLVGRLAQQEEISPRVRDAIEGVRTGRVVFGSLSNNLRNNKQVALAAVSAWGQALYYAGKACKNDKEVVLAALSRDGLVFSYASIELQHNREFVLEAVSRNGGVLDCAKEEFKNDRQFVLEAVSRNGGVLARAKEEFKNDRQFVLEAVSRNRGVLAWAKEEFKNDRQFVLEAVSRNGLALEVAIPEFKNDFGIATAAVAQNLQARQYVSPAILDRAGAEITRNLAFLPFLDPSLITYEIALNAVALNPLLLRFVPPAILAERPFDGNENKDVILSALKANPEAVNLIPWDLLTADMLSFVIERHKGTSKRELIIALIKFAREMGRKPSEEIRASHLDLASPLLEFFKNNKEIMLILINKYGLVATDVGDRLKEDSDIKAAAAQVEAASLSRAPM